MPKPDKGLCKGCGKEILWMLNENGKREPFDAKVSRVLVYGLIVDSETQKAEEAPCQIDKGHLPHFVTCPKADQFRKR